MSGQFKQFVTDEEVQETRQKRQEEWERVRQPDDPVECPEEETRSLFDQLKANKDTQERELEEENKLRSTVKGLEDEEVQFLNFVSKRQMQIERDRNTEEKNILLQMKEKSVLTIEEKNEKRGSSASTSSASAAQSQAARKSQQQLLSGAIKRKSTETKQDSEEKKTKTDSNGTSDAKLMAGLPNTNGRMQVAGVLPGIVDYADDDSSSENSDNSSDSEPDHVIVPSVQTHRVLQEVLQKMKEQQGSG